MSFDATGTNVDYAGSAFISIQPTSLGVGNKLQFQVSPADSVSLSRGTMYVSTIIEFNKHAKKWESETKHISSPTQIYLHPSYARIIGLGEAVVPLILSAMKTRPADWFYALRAITGVNPVKSYMAGDMRQMVKAWIKWGRNNGYI